MIETPMIKEPMIARVFHLKNTYMSQKSETVSAPYSVFGYFDGLSMEVYREKDGSLQDAFKDTHLTERGAQEDCDYFDIVGLRRGEKKDSEFWNTRREPYIFVSCLRFEKAASQLEAMMDELENEYRAVTYTTLDNSDLVVCTRTDTYKEGYLRAERYYEVLKKHDPDNELRKGFSFMTVSQALLDAIARKRTEQPGAEQEERAEEELALLKKELFFCSLKGVVANWDRVDGFQRELCSALGVPVKRYGMLGSEDVAFLMTVDSKEFLKQFCTGGLLTHGNPVYKAALLNIKSDILVLERER